jgi:hypothetical protein
MGITGAHSFPWDPGDEPFDSEYEKVFNTVEKNLYWYWIYPKQGEWWKIHQLSC